MTRDAPTVTVRTFDDDLLDTTHNIRHDSVGTDPVNKTASLASVPGRALALASGSFETNTRGSEFADKHRVRAAKTAGNMLDFQAIDGVHESLSWPDLPAVDTAGVAPAHGSTLRSHRW